MAHIDGYSHLVRANIPAQSWDEAWFSLTSWKGYLQSFPGFQHIRIAARKLDNDDVRLHINTTWEYAEQLEEWLTSHWSVERLLTSLSAPAYEIEQETTEVLA